MQSKKSYVYVVLSLTLLLGAFNLFASSNSKPIRARLNENFKYRLNGKAILKDTPAIIYKDTVYVPIEDYTKALGHTISIDKNTANISTQTPSPMPKPTPIPRPTPQPKPTPVPETTSTIEGTIIAIDFASNRITVVPTGKPNSSQIDIYATPTTSIVDSRTKQIYSFNDLNTDMKVTVVYKTLSTKSIPPQTRNEATQIIVNSTPQPTIQPR